MDCPPFYVLLAQSPLSNVSEGALSNTLAHPTVQYHYKDDSPLSVLPAHPNESVLVMDCDPLSCQPSVQSISTHLVVNALRIEEAPGAAAADDSKSHRNVSMFVIDTTTLNDQVMVPGNHKSPRVTLGQFKHRNKILRRIINYPSYKVPNSSQNSEATADVPSL